MIKKFIKDNRGQVLYAVIVTVMFVGLISMTTMGLTLRNYNAAVQKQQHVSDYYAADAVAELIRIGKISFNSNKIAIDATMFTETVVTDENSSDFIWVTKTGNSYEIVAKTVTVLTVIEDKQFTSWEVSYHAVQTE